MRVRRIECDLFPKWEQLTQSDTSAAEDSSVAGIKQENMTYEEKYKELVELSHSDDSEIKVKAEAWLIRIGLQGTAELKVSSLLLDLAIRNVKGEITRDEVSQLLEAHYANMPKTERKRSHGLDGDYEIIPPDSPRIKEIEEYNRKLRPVLYAQLDKEGERKRETLV